MRESSREPTLRRPARMERIGAFFFAWRNLIFTLALAALLVFLPPVPFRGDPRADLWLDVAGLALALAGQALRFAAIGYAYIHRGGKNKKVYAEELVTSGFFGISRNPLYLGNLLVLTGLFVLHNHPWVYLLGLPFFLFAYAAIVVAEEAYLTRHFGAEYQEYCRRVPRWLPDVRGLRGALAGMRFDWQRVVAKEYGSTFAWVAAALGLLAYEALVQPSFPGREVYLQYLAALLGLCAGAWAWARYLKKIKWGRRGRRAA